MIMHEILWNGCIWVSEAIHDMPSDAYVPSGSKYISKQSTIFLVL